MLTYITTSSSGNSGPFEEQEIVTASRMCLQAECGGCEMCVISSSRSHRSVWEPPDSYLGSVPSLSY